MLLLTVTSFTLAHSISLTLATLGVVHVPGPPVEACIALSIMLLATEILRLRAGHRSLTSTYPWAVAFIFGLLHGLGFASGLIDIGLPQSDVPLALFAFNCGVETGQLLFIAGVLGIARLIELLRLPNNLQYGLRTAITYAIGIASAFWFIDRVGSIFS
jgi:hydrogenase/urease accessory protein HupE